MCRDIRDIADEVIYDEDRLSKINERIYEISSYKKKYGATVEDVLEYYKNLKTKYDELVNAEEILRKLKEKECEILNLMNAREEDYDIMRILHLDKEDYYGLKKELREDFLYYLECA